MTGSNPLDWYGTAFLVFYGLCFLGCHMLGHLIAAWLRPEGSPGMVEDPDELAILSQQQEQRMAESAVARMLDSGALVLEGKRIRRGSGSPRGALEARIAQIGEEPHWRQILRAAKEEGKTLRERMVMRGLLMTSADARSIGLAAAVPMFALFVLGVAKCFVGSEREKPIGILVFFLIVTAVFIAGRIFGTDRRTKEGKAAFKDARSRHARLRIAPRGMETGTAVALFGTGVIATGPLGDFHRLRASGSSDASGGSDSDGDGGCSGGCGGCGG